MESLVTVRVNVGRQHIVSDLINAVPLIHFCGGQEQHDSLVSRPFSLPSFDNFHCAEMEGSCHIQGHWVASHRQKVDTWGRCPTKDLKPLSCMSKSRRHSYNINRVLGHYYCGWPPVCLFSVYMTLPDVITHNEISQAFPLHFYTL